MTDSHAHLDACEEPAALVERARGAGVTRIVTIGTGIESCRLLPAALERGYYVSFAGNVTYPKAPDLREAAAAVPGDRLLVETDSPYLSPQPVRGRRNEPAHLVHTIATLAEVRGEEPPALAERMHVNATAAFSLS